MATTANLSLGVGTNLGDTMEAPFEGDWHRPAQEYYFEDFKSVGFTTARIPIRWDNHTGTSPPYTVNTTWMQRVQTVVGWCLSQGLQCIINSHWDTWLDQADDAAFQAALPRYQAIWEQVAAAFAGASPSLFFESYNEPHLMSTASLNTMLSTFHAAVRPLHPTRLLILGWLNYMSPSWVQEDGAANWNAMAIPGGGADPNLAVETHSYDPYEVCGKGTEPWGKPSDVAAMHAMFGNTSLWSAQHGGLPVFMGECGCTSKQNRTGRPARLVRRLLWSRKEPAGAGRRRARVGRRGQLRGVQPLRADLRRGHPRSDRPVAQLKGQCQAISVSCCQSPAMIYDMVSPT